MNATAILERLNSLGVSVLAADDRLRLEPGSMIPSELREELREHKQEILFLLKTKGRRLKYPDAQATREELEEIVERVHDEGYVLLWSTVLCDLVAFYRDEEDRARIPPGFVPYSRSELKELFDTDPDLDHLRLIHEAKKASGGNIVGSGE